MRDKALLYLHALTGLHPGGGTALGIVDLPVQRERHTEWPTIAGSSLKGVLRAAFRTANEGREEREAVMACFGPETVNASDHAGALSISDARILAFPVRSLKGVFAWVTCRAVLERLARDLGIAGMSTLPKCSIPSVSEAACVAGSPLTVNGNCIVLEEFEFTVKEMSQDLPRWVANNAVPDRDTAARLQTHLVVLHDDDFSHFVRHATEVVARVGLDYETKTVRKGALFYEEYLPAETLFYALLICSKSRRPTWKQPASGVLQWVRDQIGGIHYLQIGGGETIGKGICAVRFSPSPGTPQ